MFNGRKEKKLNSEDKTLYVGSSSKSFVNRNLVMSESFLKVFALVD